MDYTTFLTIVIDTILGSYLILGAAAIVGFIYLVGMIAKHL